MATQLQLRRGTSQQIDNFIGAESELIANTETYELTVHDGITKGGHVVLGENRVSNCITEIPQDIKLELSGGTLTLKAGSKITSPDGTQATITVDRTGTMTSAGQYFVFANKNNGVLQLGTSNAVSLCGSGFSLPADGNTYKVFFNTTDSKIYRWDGSAWVEWSVAFPLAIITVSGGAVSSIDQVFNGFGYIGSTVFVLPGVKYLCPNGRNADGTLKNTSAKTQNVITKTIPTNLGWHYVTLNSAGTNGDLASNFYEGTERPLSPTTYSRYYDSVENKIYSIVSGTYGSAIQAVLPIRIEHDSSSPYSITSCNSPTTFHPVDYSDTEFIAHQAALGSRYVDFTPAAYGPDYKMPGDGYFYATYKLPDSNNHMLHVYATDSNTGITIIPVAESEVIANWTGQYVPNGDIAVIIPVRKDQYVHVSMFNAEKPDKCRFVYLNGAK